MIMEMCFKIILVLALCGPGIVHAQSLARTEDAAVSMTAAGEHLGQSLSELKESVTRLSAGNQALIAANARLKTRLNAVRLRLQDLTVQEDQMSAQAAKLKLVDGPRAKRMAQMEKELFDLDAKLERLAADSRAAQETMGRDQKQDEELTGRLSQMGVRLEEPSVTVPNADRSRQKEKLKLLKMIYDSKQAQQKLDQRILEARKMLPAASLPAAAPVGDWDENELRRLEAQVAQLQKNYGQWQELARKMQERARKAPAGPQEKGERDKLRSSLEGLTKENKSLKADLRGLRRRMVELDKRKSYLEGVSGGHAP